MKSVLPFLASCLCLFLLGCATVQPPKQPSYQDLANESLGLMDSLASSMRSLSDPKSAASATKSMQGIMKQMGTLKTKMQSLKAPPPEVQAMFREQMMEKQGVIMKSLMTQMMGFLNNPELTQNLNSMMSQLKQISSAMQAPR